MSVNWNICAQNCTKTHWHALKSWWFEKWDGLFGVSLWSRIRVPLWCFYFAMCPMKESREFVHVGRVVVSACESAALFQMAACLGWLWQHYRRDLFGLWPIVCFPISTRLVPPRFAGGLRWHFAATLSCWHVQQIFHKCFMSDSGTSVSTAIVNY